MLKVSFIGYLGADCNQKNINDQVAITFSVAVTKQYKNRQGEQFSKTSWIGCTIWRKPEHTRIAEFLKRGQQVFIEGEPSVRAWIKVADGSANASFDCRVTEFELLGKAAATENTAAPQEQKQESNAGAAFSGNPGDNDDLPF